MMKNKVHLISNISPVDNSGFAIVRDFRKFEDFRYSEV